MSTLLTELTRLLTPVVDAAGLVLEGVEVATVGRRRVVRVVVDLPGDRVGSVDLDRVADVSREVAAQLDESDVMGVGAYALEVTTPGVDRPLSEVRHWQRARTRLVRVQRHSGPEVLGRVLEVEDAAAVLEVDGSPQRVGWDEVRSAVVEVEFRRPAKGEPAEPAESAKTDEPDETDREHS